jgi:hypothetical protein
MIRRVVKLEQVYCVRSAQVPPQVIRVTYVAPDGEVTHGYDVVVGQPAGGITPLAMAVALTATYSAYAPIPVVVPNTASPVAQAATSLPICSTTPENS